MCLCQLCGFHSVSEFTTFNLIISSRTERLCYASLDILSRMYTKFVP